MRTTPTWRTAGAPARPALPAIAVTIGLAGAGWMVAIPRMRGMDMGVMTPLGSFPYFLSVWVPMMAAMMLPGLAPSVMGRRTLHLTGYLGSYLAVWGVFGVLVFALYRPHSTLVAGLVTAAAGLYELTPVKRRFRQTCRDRPSSGWILGACCVGSTAGLMLVMVALGPMSLAWMTVLAAVVLLQKLAPPNALVDVPLAVAVVGLGLAQFA